MAKAVNLGVWNANGLNQRSQELKAFLYQHNIDIMLISETHYTSKNYLKIPNYTTYHTQHPDGTAHGGTAVIIKSTLKHHEKEKYTKDYLQATTITIEDWNGAIDVSAIYSPPKHSIKKEQYTEFFKSLGQRFIAAGDFNAKHPSWGSRSLIPTPKGKQLYLSIMENHLKPIAPSEPTYWPTDRRKIPDVIDFCLVKGIHSNYFGIKNIFDLSSDHSPLLVTLHSKIVKNSKPPSLCTSKTNWPLFRLQVEEKICCNIPLKSEKELDDAVENFTNLIQESAWKATPPAQINEQRTLNSTKVQQKILEKRKLRKQWQITRSPHDKAKFNKSTKALKKILQEEKEASIQEFLVNLSPSETTNYSLWKVTRKIGQLKQSNNLPLRSNDGSWARTPSEKAALFASHLSEVFQPARPQTRDGDEEIAQHLLAPYQMELPTKNFRYREVKKIIKKELKCKKAPGWDLITGRVLKELPEKAIRFITILYNASLRLCYFPAMWKVAEVIMVPKPGKNLTDVTSYRPISILPTFAKVLE